mmetsp:Transcript_94667/g.203224  ORF Transcript_94667/g.203224 Transcript_94667/m.203224 type:complete len:711 (+) Transcript_94667:54-2186(+)
MYSVLGGVLCFAVVVRTCAVQSGCDSAGGCEVDTGSAEGLQKPNILFLLADDYGWHNLGYHLRGEAGPDAAQARAEVNTQNLDELIDNGILIDRHYAYKICSPSRSSLQSGRLAINVNTKNNNVNSHNPDDPSSGYAGIPANMTLLGTKMKQGGYMTHFVGKWDVGMANIKQTPIENGYDTFFGYYQHANDYWMEAMPFQSTGEIDTCLNRWVDFSMYTKDYVGGVTPEIRKQYGCNQVPERFTRVSQTLKGLYNATGCLSKSGGGCLDDGCYEEAMLLNRSLTIISDHSTNIETKGKPLFLFHAFHALHTPLQITKKYIDKLDSILDQHGASPFCSSQRKLYAAMVLFMDDAVGQLVTKLKQTALWDNTLVIFAADNGGPIYEPAAANNFPLKGGKYADWEGGVRTNAFVSGGAIPKRNRGTVHKGIVSIADWYGTLCDMIGVDAHDKEAEAANVLIAAENLNRLANQQNPLLPPVDSVAQWQFILNGSNGRPDPLVLSSQAILDYPYKLVVGRQVYSMWQGELYPNCTTIANAPEEGPYFQDMQIFDQQLKLSNRQWQQDKLTEVHDCRDGCLFNVEADPSETIDLAKDPRNTTTMKELLKLRRRLDSVKVFEPDRGSQVFEACKVEASIGGFFGPFVEADRFYSPVNMTRMEKLEMDKFVKKLAALNKGLQSRPGQIFDWFVSKYPVRRSAKKYGADKCLCTVPLLV